VCLILLAWRVHPEYPLVLAANRDEFRDRPTEAAQWWLDRPTLLAGRDLQARGTWLGITRAGRLAALTNYRDPQRAKPNAPSRGRLVVDALMQEVAVAEHLDQLRRISPAYADFNLIWTDGHELGVFESVPGDGRTLPPGVYGLSNHLLDTPWPKVERAKSRLAEALSSLPQDERLLELLRDDQPAADEQLPRTGVSVEWERLLSSAFIRGPTYGTVSSTVIRLGADGAVHFREWRWQQDGTLGGEVSYRFQLPGPDARA